MVEPDETSTVLKRLSHEPASWRADFDEEIERAYDGPDPLVNYTRGHAPNTAALKPDPRVDFIDHAERNHLVDRRLWTWEAHFEEGPDADEVEAIVLSREALMQLFRLRREGVLSVPPHVRLISPREERGLSVDIFDREEVAHAFAGEVVSK